MRKREEGREGERHVMGQRRDSFIVEEKCGGMGRGKGKQRINRLLFLAPAGDGRECVASTHV